VIASSSKVEIENGMVSEITSLLAGITTPDWPLKVISVSVSVIIPPVPWPADLATWTDCNSNSSLPYMLEKWNLTCSPGILTLTNWRKEFPCKSISGKSPLKYWDEAQVPV